MKPWKTISLAFLTSIILIMLIVPTVSAGFFGARGIAQGIFSGSSVGHYLRMRILTWDGQQFTGILYMSEPGSWVKHRYVVTGTLTVSGYMEFDAGKHHIVFQPTWVNVNYYYGLLSAQGKLFVDNHVGSGMLVVRLP